MAEAKCLHWSFFVKNRIAEIAFYKNILGMKVLKHYEYEEKGAHPPAKRSRRMWSTTLLSYGDQSRYLCVQLIFSYNPDVDFVRGNDYTGMTIQSEKVLDRAEQADIPISEIKNGVYKVISSPNGYQFFILDKPEPEQHDLILKLHLTCSDEMNVLLYWHCVLGGKYLSHYLGHSVVIGFQDYGVKFKFRKIADPVIISSHGCRLTCSTTLEKIEEMEKFLKSEDLEISLPITPLEVTPNGCVLTLIVNDFDGREIAMVDENEYDRLPYNDDVEGHLMLSLKKELIYRGEKPILDQMDGFFYKFMDYCARTEECRKRRSFRVLGPLDAY